MQHVPYVYLKFWKQRKTERLATACGHRIAHRKWKEIKLQPGTAGPGNRLGCCLISFHFMWAILCPQAIFNLDQQQGEARVEREAALPSLLSRWSQITKVGRTGPTRTKGKVPIMWKVAFQSWRHWLQHFCKEWSANPPILTTKPSAREDEPGGWHVLVCRPLS